MEVKESFHSKPIKLVQDDPCYKTKKHSLEIQRAKELGNKKHGLLSMKLSKKKTLNKVC